MHERFAPNPAAFDLVHTHCAIVAEIAAQLIARDHLDVDADLVRAVFAAMAADYGEPDLSLLAATHGHVLV